jgi:hypothetical protein
MACCEKNIIHDFMIWEKKNRKKKTKTNLYDDIAFYFTSY